MGKAEKSIRYNSANIQPMFSLQLKVPRENVFLQSLKEVGNHHPERSAASLTVAAKCWLTNWTIYLPEL